MAIVGLVSWLEEQFQPEARAQLGEEYFDLSTEIEGISPTSATMMISCEGGYRVGDRKFRVTIEEIV